MTLTTNERFSVVRLKDEPRVYLAFVYRIDVMEKNSNTFKHYFGWHKGAVSDVETQKYWHSSGNNDLVLALENADKIIYNILDYGSEVEMATLENKLCSEVDATNNPLYYNKNNGGGRYCHAVKNFVDRADDINQNIMDGSYPVKLYDKKKLERMLNERSFIQVRVAEFDVEHIRNLRDQMLGKTADEFDPIHVLMPENINDLEIIIGGIHSTRAAIKVPTMNGLNAVEIPYEDWSKLSPVELEFLGLSLNPQPTKPALANSLEDAAHWVVRTIEEKELYKNRGALPIEPLVPWYDAREISDALKRMGFGAHQRGDITKKAKVIWAENQVVRKGDNFIDFGDKSLEENPRIKLWLENRINYLLSSKNIDKVVKVSAGQHLWSQIQKSLYEYDSKHEVFDHPERIVVLIYFPSILTKTLPAWLKSYNTFLYDYKKGLHHIVNIDVEFLPERTSEIKLPELPETND
jgi:hypothetical protein